ncbi:MAG: Gfo/Idh/MocA family oxidoreductase [Phycisphaerae bacterium]|nr:Gfo/Idh/MocA family oxidoreductase [Phycisphaerae bacterium]
MPNPITLGVVGAGSIADFHFKAFAQSKTRIAVISDVNRQRAEPYLRSFGAAYAADFHAVIATTDVNVVVCLTPSKFHYEMVKAALNAGKHVICEKTLTLSAAESLELARLAQKNGLLLFTSYMKRFFPAVKKAKELMPALGHITSVYAWTYQGMGIDIHTGEVPESCRRIGGGDSAVKQLIGGGILVAGGSHILDMLLYLVGRPRSVLGMVHRRPGLDVDFLAHAMMQLPAGGVVHLEANWHSLKKIGYEQRGWDEGFEISGVNGRLILNTPVWNQPEHNAAQLSFYNNQAQTWTDFRFDIVNPFVEAEAYFLSCIAAGRQDDYDPYVGYRVDHLLELTQLSSDRGTLVDVRWEDGGG